MSAAEVLARTPVNVRVTSPVLKLALESIIAGNASCYPSKRNDAVVITDDMRHVSRNTLLIIDESSLSAARAMSLVNAGKLGGACPVDALEHIGHLVHTLELHCVGVPALLPQRARTAPEMNDALFEILALVRKGYSNSDIARYRHCSVATVKRRISELFNLFGVVSRMELIRSDNPQRFSI